MSNLLKTSIPELRSLNLSRSQIKGMLPREDRKSPKRESKNSSAMSNNPVMIPQIVQMSNPHIPTEYWNDALEKEEFPSTANNGRYFIGRYKTQ